RSTSSRSRTPWSGGGRNPLLPRTAGTCGKGPDVEALYSMLDRPLGAPSFSAEAAVLAFLLAFVLGQAIAWTYTRTHTGLSYSRSFTQSLVLITVVVAMVMFVIGDSIVTA